MITIPVQPIANQTLTITLESQNVEIYIFSTIDHGMFVNVESNGERVATGVKCLDAVPMIRNQYLGFVGNLVWVDTRGASDPTYDGLGDRYQLAYITAAEYDEFFNQ